METGVNKPIHSLFDLKALEALSIVDDCHISIQIGLNGFSFCIHKDSEILGLESYNYPLSQIEKSIESNKWIMREYASSNITISTKKFTLIPSTLYKNEDKKSYLEFNHIRSEKLEVLADEIPQIDSYSVYGISTAEQEIITTYFSKSTVKHFSSIHIPNMLANNKNNEDKKMIVNVDYKQMHITVIDHSKLVYFNVFNHKNAHDCIYFILFVCEQINLNPEQLVLELMGDVKKDSEFYNLAYTYIQTINFSKRLVKLSPNINSLDNHEYYTLLHQHLCE
jgi:uncharacterized protein YjaG (DUF416 family)